MWNTQPNYVENYSILWKSAQMVGETPLRTAVFGETRQGRCE